MRLHEYAINRKCLYKDLSTVVLIFGSYNLEGLWVIFILK